MLPHSFHNGMPDRTVSLLLLLEGLHLQKKAQCSLGWWWLSSVPSAALIKQTWHPLHNSRRNQANSGKQPTGPTPKSSHPRFHEPDRHRPNHECPDKNLLLPPCGSNHHPSKVHHPTGQQYAYPTELQTSQESSYSQKSTYHFHPSFRCLVRSPVSPTPQESSSSNPTQNRQLHQTACWQGPPFNPSQTTTLVPGSVS